MSENWTPDPLVNPPLSTPPASHSRLDSMKTPLVIAGGVILGLVFMMFATGRMPFGGKLGGPSYEALAYNDAAEELALEPVEEWQKVEGDRFIIYLPDRLSPLNNQVLERRIGSVNPDIETKLMMLALTDNFDTNVMVAAFFTDDDTMTPDKYVKGVAEEMEKGGMSIKEKAAYELGTRRVGRLIYEQSLGGLSKTGVQFAYIKDDMIWVVTGTSTVSFDMWLPVFEKIASGLEIKPAAG